MSKRWQYKVVELPYQLFGGKLAERAQAELDKLGAQGWELVSVVQSHYADALRMFLRRRTEMRYLQSFLLMFLLCLPAAMTAMAAEGDHEPVATATRLLALLQDGAYTSPTDALTAHRKDDPDN